MKLKIAVTVILIWLELQISIIVIILTQFLTNKDLRFTGKTGAECTEQNGASLVSPNYSVIKPVQQLVFLSHIDLHMGIRSC